MDQIIEFATNHPYLAGLAFMLTLLLVANEIRLATRKGLDILPSEVVTLVNNGAKVLDVRSVELYRSGHIVNAINIAHDDLEARYEKALKAHKDKFIVVCDDNGLQAGKASLWLRQKEYKAVNLKGGLTAWSHDSLPLEKGK